MLLVTTPGDEIKINVDGSFSAVNCNGGSGFVIRNCNGDSVGEGARYIPQALDALQTEALAYLSSLRWAHFWGMTKIQVETDSQQIGRAHV